VYNWLVFIHIIGVLGFVLAHGASAAMGLRLRKERNPERIRALLQLSSVSTSVFYVSLLLLLTGGVAAGFKLHWWSQGWIWTALVTLLVTMGAMYALATPYYRRVRRVLQVEATGSSAVGPEELDEVLGGPRPLLIAGIGTASLAFIAYLMVLKPF
jgi:cytochrome bd-type quinol oxidase subunit 2